MPVTMRGLWLGTPLCRNWDASPLCQAQSHAPLWEWISEAGAAPGAVAQAGPGDVAESQSRQRIVTGTAQDGTGRLSAVLLGSELLHGPGCAQGPQLMATSCRTLVGLRYTRQPGLWALSLSGKGCSAVWILPGSWEGALLQGRGWRKCLSWPGTVFLVPGWAAHGSV